MNVSAHVEALGSCLTSVNVILGEVPGKLNGGTSEHPVRKIKTSLSEGVSSG